MVDILTRENGHIYGPILKKHFNLNVMVVVDAAGDIFFETIRGGVVHDRIRLGNLREEVAKIESRPDGGKIAAMKFIRAVTDCGLREAKEYMDDPDTFTAPGNRR